MWMIIFALKLEILGLVIGQKMAFIFLKVRSHVPSNGQHPKISILIYSPVNQMFGVSLSKCTYIRIFVRMHINL